MTVSLAHKPDFEQAQHAWDALWNHEILGRPCTRIVAPCRPDAPACPNIVPVDTDFNAVIRGAEAYLDSHAFLGEAMPAFRPGFGPDQMAGMLGAPLVMSEDGRTSWSKKIVTDWERFLPLRLSQENPVFRRTQEFHALAARAFDGKCLLAEIDMHSNIDLLEGLRGAQPLLFDIVDRPDLVLRAMQDARRIYRDVYAALHVYGDKVKWGTTCNLPLYDRGRYNRIQADFIALLGPRMFREFVLPAIEEEASFLDRSLFHLDGPDALRHLDDLLAIDALDGIQWVSGAGQPHQIEWPEVLHRIQKAGKITILHLSEDDVRRIHGEYDPALLVYDVSVQSEEDGLRLLEWLEVNT